jgi:tRNA pseudouridine55 synthase
MVLPVNKSAGLSTYDCIRRLKRVVSVGKVGHSGTLDPQARGLVLILTGEATKLSGFLMDLPKRYVANIKLGEATDTHDATGTVVEASDWESVTERDIENVLPRFCGKRTQVPPMYSALKHKGKPLYVLARMGQKIERTPREVETYEIRLTRCDLPVFQVEVFCSRGLYIRVLAEEIGAALGVPAHLESLVRTQIGHFTLEDAVPDEEFGRSHDMKWGFSLSEAVRHLPAVEISVKQARNLEHGVVPRVREALPPQGSTVRLLRPDGGLGAICDVGAAGMLTIRRVFKDACQSERFDVERRS